MKFRLDHALYGTTSERREREWQLALTELNYEMDGEPPTLWVSRREDGRIDIRIECDPPQTISLSFESLKQHFRDYRRVIEQLVRSTASGTRQFETLDYAKKLVHDDAGETVMETFSGVLDLEHTAARKLFTLIFLLSSELPEALVTRHRHG